MSLVTNERVTQRITIIDNQSIMSSLTIEIQAYDLSDTRTLYVQEGITIQPNEVVTREYFADLDGYEFIFSKWCRRRVGTSICMRKKFILSNLSCPPVRIVRITEIPTVLMVQLVLLVQPASWTYRNYWSTRRNRQPYKVTINIEATNRYILNLNSEKIYVNIMENERSVYLVLPKH